MPPTPWVDPDRHGWVLHPKAANDWEEIVNEYGGSYPGPLTQILAVVREGGCQTVVIENRYVDADYRSEHAAFWSQRFQPPSPFTRRLHFFASKLEDDDLHRIPDDHGYLGYSVIRPIHAGPVGRTVLKPPPALADATLAKVRDEVSIFGNRLSVEGVPFCQQDGEYLRCAQAAAWICHYTAARRGLVGRETTAGVLTRAPALGSEHRALPSPGMTVNQLQAVFGAMGQPALFYGLSNMPTVLGVPQPDALLDEDGKPVHPGYWDTRMLSIICRYLNSGFPVLIAAVDHAFAIVGWFRDGNEIRFIACDDQVGPYEVIDSPFGHYKTPWSCIMIPLPPKVFLTGESAENAAFKLFRAIGRSVEALNPIADGLQSGELALRSSLREVRSLKESFVGFAGSDEALRALRLARLPHYVWTVEAHDRSTCGDGPCVFAAALFDSTSYDGAPVLSALSIPGRVGIYPPDGGTPETLAGVGAPWQPMLGVH